MYRSQDFRAEMARKGYTIKRLCEITGLSHHIINDIRMGRGIVDIEDLAKVAIALEIEWETLFKGVVPKLEEFQDELAARRNKRQYQFEESSLFTDKIAA